MLCMPPVVGGEDSTVVGISGRSPASGEGVGGCLQSECVSERQGTCCCMHPPIFTTFCHKELPIQTYIHDPTPTQRQHTQTLTIAATFYCI